MRRSALGLAVLVLTAGCAEWRARWPGPDAPFVPTPALVGVEMLRLAGVTRDDVVYDLGSGDGRVVIAAAREFGALAVGVELEAELVQSSREAALAAGVGERVRFLWQDLFATSLVDATVITLYLGDDVNLRLRPKLLREVRPGARVVSHHFDMGDWKADAVRRVRAPDGERRVHLWIVPADVAGRWEGTVAGPDRVLRLGLRQTFQALEGTVDVGGRVAPVVQGRVAGTDVRFRAGGWRFAGRANGDRLEGRAVDGSAEVSWTARRTGR